MHRLHLSAATAVLLACACAEAPGTGNVDTGSDADAVDTLPPLDGADDTDTAEPDVDVGPDVPDVLPDSEPDGPPDASDADADASPIGCDLDADCPEGVCVDLLPGPGNGICAPRCVDDSQCPEGTDCVVIGDEEGSYTVCLDVDFCVDPDTDGYGIGPGCRGADCAEDNPAINAGAVELCNGDDDDCDGEIDNNTLTEGDDCATGFPGVCAEGRLTCIGGANDCVPRVPPSAEVCDARDNDCDGTVDEDPTDAPTFYRDADLDRFGDPDDAVSACAAPEGYVDVAEDCDDSVRAVNPAAVEICDGVDNDCDLIVDGEGTPGALLRWADTDGDGFGDPEAPAWICGEADGFVANDDDCAPDDELVNPDADEVCDGIDNDCDLVVDPDTSVDAPAWYADTDEDLWGDDDDVVRSCAAPAGRVAVAGDCEPDDESIHPGAADECDGVDNDCNDVIDDGATVSRRAWYADRDEDLRGDPSDVVLACDPIPGRVEVAGDCNDDEPAAWTGRAEICDGIDNNCEAGVDEGVRLTFYRDADEDLRGDPLLSTLACEQPAGYVDNSSDCNDEEPAAWTGRAELCDGIDNNCVGGIDEGAGTTWYRDADTDGRGDASLPRVACEQPAGYVDNASDCNDDEVAAWTGRTEVCDGIDNNCIGGIDEGVTSTFWRDQDTDGRGNPGLSIQACSAPAGYVDNANDCNDAEIAAWTGRAEICDGIDNNCVGGIDEGTGSTWYRDQDTDGRGNPAVTTLACSQPAGYVANADDCNDAEIAAWTGRAEICDGIDNNCVGGIDEGTGSTWYRDFDGDGYGDPLSTVLNCSRPGGYVSDNRDCNDNNRDVNPGASELCSTNYDDDCDTQINESSAIDATWWFLDDDGDGQGATAPLGIPIATVRACTRPPDLCIIFCFLERIPYVGNDLDCDDSSTRARVGGGPEVCDGYDNDCNGTRDDGFSVSPFYYDGDGDGVGDRRIDACVRPIDNPGDWVTVCCDIDDDDPSID